MRLDLAQQVAPEVLIQLVPEDFAEAVGHDVDVRVVLDPFYNGGRPVCSRARHSLEFGWNFWESVADATQAGSSSSAAVVRSS